MLSRTSTGPRTSRIGELANDETIDSIAEASDWVVVYAPGEQEGTEHSSPHAPIFAREREHDGDDGQIGV